jgi:hypothetical protein
MRRLAICDSLCVLLLTLCLGSFAAIAEAVLTSDAHAFPWPNFQTCLAPAVCPGGSGSCVNCNAGNQSGNCSGTPYPFNCNGNLNYCVGNIIGEMNSCNCATSGC